MCAQIIIKNAVQLKLVLVYMFTLNASIGYLH